MSARFRGVGLLAVVVVTGMFAWACTEETTGTNRSRTPRGTSSGDTDPDGPGPGTTTSSSSSSGGPGPNPDTDPGPEEDAGNKFCPDPGATFVNGAGCAVSFKNDVMPLLAGCARDGCHKSRNPKFTAEDPTKAWETFAKYEFNNGKRLTNPCSTAVADSFIIPTIDPALAEAAGARLMPPNSTDPPNPPLPANAIATVKQWVECGAPNN